MTPPSPKRDLSLSCFNLFSFTQESFGKYLCGDGPDQVSYIWQIFLRVRARARVSYIWKIFGWLWARARARAHNHPNIFQMYDTRARALTRKNICQMYDTWSGPSPHKYFPKDSCVKLNKLKQLKLRSRLGEGGVINDITQRSRPGRLPLEDVFYGNHRRLNPHGNIFYDPPFSGIASCVWTVDTVMCLTDRGLYPTL